MTPTATAVDSYSKTLTKSFSMILLKQEKTKVEGYCTYLGTSKTTDELRGPTL